jgi:hypothetical protein
MTTIFNQVAATCTRRPRSRSKTCTAVTMTKTGTAIAVGDAGRTVAASCPIAIAAKATGAAKPTVTETQPANWPSRDWKMPDRK